MTTEVKEKPAKVEETPRNDLNEVTVTASQLKAFEKTDRSIAMGITSMAKRTADFKRLTRDLAIAIIIKTEKDGNCSPAIDLMAAIPAKYRTALKYYFETFSPINVSYNAKKGTGSVKLWKADKDERYNEFNVLGAIECVSWWECSDPMADDSPKVLSGDLFAERIEKYFTNLCKNDKIEFSQSDESLIMRRIDMLMAVSKWSMGDFRAFEHAMKVTKADTKEQAKAA